MLIVPEPPPHATEQTVLRCLPRAPESSRVLMHPIGHDGWVRDLVLTLAPARPAEIRESIDQLHLALYYSTYKADVIGLPVGPPPAAGPGAFDLQVAASDLSNWLIQQGEPFHPVEGGPGASMPQLLAARRSGVFLSEARGLVAWIVPRRSDFARERARARQFAVDSDLILGAIATRNDLALIARERVVPTSLLPPLRVETMELLANVGGGELAQSYERNRIFAGRFDDRWDWAPIYLSPALVNTEYGSLLNITDQILKSWSSHGEVEYERFGYPMPPRWPFSRPLLLELGTGEVTFNWNTAGAGYAVLEGDKGVFALHRTGALPVSYIPGGRGADTTGQERVAEYESTAYEYFAGLGDPNLARVVQYAGLYQAFFNFGKDRAGGPPPTDAQRRADGVADHRRPRGHRLATGGRSGRDRPGRRSPD